jgi:glycosyltransferase involved in cell wall biosynthesis
MLVAIITKYWKNSEGGGIKTYITNLYQELKSRDRNIIVIFNEGYDKENYHVSGNKLLFSLRSLLILAKIKPDVIHSQGNWYCLLTGVIYKKIYGCTLIDTFRSEPTQNLSIIFRILYQYLIDNCDKVTFVSSGLKTKIEETYGFKFRNFYITYPGVRPKNSSNEEIKAFREKYGLSDNCILLLVQAFTANLLKSNGVKLVIQSLKKLQNNYPNIVLIVTREGYYTNELKEYAKKEGVFEKVIFTGNLENPFVPLSICNIFLFPWLGKSGVGNALLEAMCAGKPIIATLINGGGVSEIINDGENGVLVDADPNKIAEKIEYLLKNKEFANRIGKNAKDKAEANFTWGNVANIFEYIYFY